MVSDLVEDYSQSVVDDLGDSSPGVSQINMNFTYDKVSDTKTEEQAKISQNMCEMIASFKLGNLSDKD